MKRTLIIRISVILMALLICSGVVPRFGGITGTVNAAEAELIVNGGFESGLDGWNVIGDFHADPGFTHPHTGTRYAYLSNASGNPGNNLVGNMYQTVSIPSSATSATLTFWVNISTDETGSIPHDVLDVTIQNSAGSYLDTVAVLSNVDSQSIGVYTQKFFSLAPYIGQTIHINLLGTTDGSLPTVFRIDDVSIEVTSADTAPTQAPVQISPYNGATDVVTSPIFQWQPVSGATYYGLYISEPPYGPDNLVFDSELDYGPISGTSLTLPLTIQEGVVYCWNMRAGNSAGWGPFSQPSWSFTTHVTSTPTVGSWEKTFGGTMDDIIYAVRPTSDGGFIATGVTNTYDQNGLGELAGYGDLWLLKADSQRNEQWEKTFSSGNNLDVGYDVQQTDDGGYVITGWYNSLGVIPGVDTTDTGDVWLIKTDAQGNEQWNRTFGGSSLDIGRSVRQTVDGGYIIACDTRSFGAGWTDAMLIKADASGIEQWQMTYGGGDGDHAMSVQQTSDGGYMFAGFTYNYGGGDAWLVKTDASGNEQWYKTFGGSGSDAAHSLSATTDGGYVIAGFTFSYGVAGDMWLIKIDSSGTEQWDRTYGGGGEDIGESVCQTTDGGYVVAGSTTSFGSGGRDAYLVKTDSMGNELWHTTVGGTGNDFAHSVLQTGDGSYVFGGSTASSGAGGADGWLVKVGAEGNINTLVASFTFSPDKPIPDEQITFDASSSKDANGRTIVKYEWDWESDGNYDEESLSCPPIAVHRYLSAGTYHVTLRITDDQGLTATKSEDVTVIDEWSYAIITDLHIGRGYDIYGGEDYYLTERLTSVVNQIIGLSSKPRFVAVLGDISDSGTFSEFQEARNILNVLNQYGIPYIPVMGNHDCGNDPAAEAESTSRTNFINMFWSGPGAEQNLGLIRRLSQQPIVDDDGDPNLLNYAFSCGGTRFIVLDNVKAGSSVAQYPSVTKQWLSYRLADAKEPVVILSHIPVVDPSPFTTDILPDDIKTYIKEVGAINWPWDYAYVQQAINLSTTRVLGWFSGHIHGYDGYPIPFGGDVLASQLGFDTFMDANLEFPGIGPDGQDMPVPVVTTEALMVGQNEVGQDDQKQVIRVVTINPGSQSIKFGDDMEGYTPAINPRFTFSPGELPKSATFSAHCFSDRSVTYDWDFDSVGKCDATGQLVKSHIFAEAGSHTVTLTVTDNNDPTITEKITHIIQVPDSSTVHTIISPYSLSTPMIVTTTGDPAGDLYFDKDTYLSVMISKSPLKPVGTFLVHFGDATSDIDFSSLIADTDPVAHKSVIHMDSWPAEVEQSKILYIPSSGVGTVYICPGAKSLDEVNPHNATVWLNVGETKVGMTLSITYYDGQEYYVVSGVTGTGGGEWDGHPVAEAGGPYTGTEGSPITFNGSGSHDPDGTIAKYEWDFGDGSTATGVSPTHKYSEAGVYTVSLTVTDNDGLTNSDTAEVTVREAASSAIPSVSHWGAIVMAIALAGCVIWAVRRRIASSNRI